MNNPIYLINENREVIGINRVRKTGFERLPERNSTIIIFSKDFERTIIIKRDGTKTEYIKNKFPLLIIQKPTIHL